MALGPRLDLRQTQSLVMTPQLQQAIRLLALSNLEIEGFIAEELDKNPLLEKGNDEEAPVHEAGEFASPDGDYEDGAGGEDAPDEPMTSDRLIEAGDAARDAPLDADLDTETFHHDSAVDSQRGPDASLGFDGSSGSGEALDVDMFEGGSVSLHDHLIRQAGEILSGQDLTIGVALIDQLDEAGYLSASLLDLANRLGVPLARIDQALAVVQSLEPTGVGARSLSECLALQAREIDRYDPAMARLIDNLDILAKGDLARLRRICGVDDEDLVDMIRELRAYDPKPGLRFSTERIQPIEPDIFVHRTKEGWAIELNNATLPRLLVNRSYYVELAAGPQDKTSKAWLSDCLASANWLVKALDQRARTIVKVTTELVKQQEAFFLKGVEHLKPLTLRMVADAIGMHESTVSRVTSNKYLACERGVYELKYFFTSGVGASDGGDAVSAEAVKSHIRALIAAEGREILSDDKLVELLNAKGFEIARRTVAKYREAIGLGSSVQRRRAKAIGTKAA